MISNVDLDLLKSIVSKHEAAYGKLPAQHGPITGGSCGSGRGCMGSCYCAYLPAK